MGDDVRLGRVRSKDWQRVARGVYVPVDDDVGQRTRLSALQEVLQPSAVFTHLTAAREHGWWLPPLPRSLPVFVSQLASQPRTRRRGIHIVRHRDPVETWHRAGLDLASPAETLLACARDLALVDLVVLVDSALHRRDVLRAELESVAGSGRVGGPALRRALDHADARSESPWETVLRLLHVAFDVEVEPQRDFISANGMFVARADLWLVGTSTIHEYDGSTHLTVAGQRHDLARLRRLGDEGITRRGYTSRDVTAQAHVILQDVDRTLGRAHDPRRLAPWYAWLAESCFSRDGRDRLSERLGLGKRSLATRSVP